MIVAAREQDSERLVEIYEDVDDVVLSIDGLQPEKGHETLYVVRELTKKCVWFGEPLVSSSAAEVRWLFVRAREWAERLGKKVRLWISEELRTETDAIPSEDRPSEPIAAAATNKNTPATVSSANAVVLDYCTAVKGILNDDQGGPLHPPGIRMVEALQSVRESVERCLAQKKGRC